MRGLGWESFRRLGRGELPVRRKEGVEGVWSWVRRLLVRGWRRAFRDQRFSDPDRRRRRTRR